MGLLEFFKRRRVSLVSPLSREQISLAVNRAHDARFTPSGGRIRGGALADRLSLYVQPFGWDNQASPRLTGRLRGALDGTELSLAFGAAGFMYLLWPVWYTGLAIVGLRMLTAGPSYGVVALGAVFSVGPVILQWAFLRNAEDDLEQMLAFLETEVGAVATTPARSKAL